MSDLKLLLRQSNGLHWADVSIDGGKTVFASDTGSDSADHAIAQGRFQIAHAIGVEAMYRAAFKAWFFAMPILFFGLFLLTQNATTNIMGILFASIMSGGMVGWGAAAISYSRARTRAMGEIDMVAATPVA